MEMESKTRNYLIQEYVYDSAMNGMSLEDIERGLDWKFGVLDKKEHEDAPIQALTIAYANDFSMDEIEICLRPYDDYIASVVPIAEIIRDYKLSAKQVEELCFGIDDCGTGEITRFSWSLCTTIYEKLKKLSYEVIKAKIKIDCASGYSYIAIDQHLCTEHFSDFEKSLYVKYANSTDDRDRLDELGDILRYVNIDMHNIDPEVIKLYTDISLTIDEAEVIQKAVSNLSADRARRIARLIKRTKSGS